MVSKVSDYQMTINFCIFTMHNEEYAYVLMDFCGDFFLVFFVHILNVQNRLQKKIFFSCQNKRHSSKT